MKISFIKLILFQLLGLGMVSCGSSDKKNSQDFFDPDLDITVSSLTSKGFNKTDSLSVIGKSNGNEAILHTFLNDRDPIYSRTIWISGLPDSLSVVNWIETNQGIIYSDWNQINKHSKQFFIKGRKSGLIFSGVYRKKSLFIYFDYPDTETQIRSKNRIINKEGKTIIQGVNNDGNSVTIEKDFRGYF